MALKRSILEDELQPPKRLKTSNRSSKNIFQILEKHSNDHQIWTNLLTELTGVSDKMQVLHMDVKSLINLIGNCLESGTEPELRKIIVKCAIVLTTNKNFNLFFKQDFIGYCNLVAYVLKNSGSVDECLSFLKSERLFDKILLAQQEQSYRSFIEVVLPSIGKALETFEGNDIIFNEASKHVTKCVFTSNLDSFSIYLSAIFENQPASEECPKILIENLLNCNFNDSRHIYRLILHSFSSCQRKSEIVYRFLIVLFQTRGFKIKSMHHEASINKNINFNLALQCLTSLCSTITNVKQFDTVLGFNFGSLLENLLSASFQHVQQPSTEIYDFLTCLLKISPETVEKSLESILGFIVVAKKNEHEVLRVKYENFMVILLEMLGRRIRLNIFVGKLLKAMKDSLRREKMGSSEKLPIRFVGLKLELMKREKSTYSSFTDKFLGIFTECIVEQFSWEYNNLFRCFLFYLENVFDEKESLDEEDIRFLYAFSQLFCQFLLSIRIAEQNTSQDTVKKFTNSNEKLKEILKKFGKILIKLQHNEMLVKTYLNISFSLGELQIILNYYSIDNCSIFESSNAEIDSSPYNVTYIHPYLSKDEWSLIFQRVANFGETFSRNLMLKLCLQKLRAMLLFEANINSSMLTSVLKSIVLPGLGEYHKSLLAEPLVLKLFVDTMDSDDVSQLCCSILQEAVDSKSLYYLRNALQENDFLLDPLIYICLSKINEILISAKVSNLNSVKVFSKLKEKRFFGSLGHFELNDQTILDVENVVNVALNSSSTDGKLEMTELHDYLRVLEVLPLRNCENCFAISSYLIVLWYDLKNFNLNFRDICETAIIDLEKGGKNSFLFKSLNVQSVSVIIEEFSKYNELLNVALKNVYIFNRLDLIENWMDLFCKNIQHSRYSNSLNILLDTVNKRKKTVKISDEKIILGNYQTTICKVVMKSVADKSNACNLIKVFDVVMKIILSSENQQEILEVITPCQYYIDLSNNPTFTEKCPKDVLSFFATVIRNANQLKIEKSFSESVWIRIKNMHINDENRQEFSRLVNLIFEHISESYFKNIVNEMFNQCASYLKNSELQLFKDQMVLIETSASVVLGNKKGLLFQTILVSYYDKLLSCVKIQPETSFLIHENVTKVLTAIVRNRHVYLIPSVRDLIFVTVPVLITNQFANFATTFDLCISLLESLLKLRKLLTMDYLSPLLQNVRILLRNLCAKSDVHKGTGDEKRLADCAYKLEKLIVRLVNCEKDIKRIAAYMIADIISEYEQITISPGVKNHLTWCINHLLTLCDSNSVAFMNRTMSIASSEIFKVIYQNYLKYFKFVGKV